MDRKKLIERIKALMAKTVENGCTEFEAMAALEKVSELMDANNIADADISFGGEGVEQGALQYNRGSTIEKSLAIAVAIFAGCKVWNEPGYGGTKSEVVFLGLESDVEIAKWLLGTLSDFVRRGLKDHMAGRDFESSRHKTMARNGFVMGCCGRISARLKGLEESSRAASPVVDGRSLIVVKGALVDEAFAKLGMNLRAVRRSRRTVASDSYSAGRAAGDRASFSRPISGGGGAALIGRG